MDEFDTEGPSLSEIVVTLAIFIGVIMLVYAAC